MRGVVKILRMGRGAKGKFLLGGMIYIGSFIVQLSGALAAENQSKFDYYKNALKGFIDGQNLNPSQLSYIVAALFCGLGLIAILMRRRKFANRKGVRALHELVQLEEKLNQTEAVLLAEPQILFVWENDGKEPFRVSGDIHNIKNIPTTEKERSQFSSWLTGDSVKRLESDLEQLRKTGSSFNEAVTMKNGTVLEADGRPAGRFVTLRLREAAGQKVELAKLKQEYRRLQQQTDAIRSVVNRAPLPIWVRDVKGRLSWVNEAYVSAVDATDVKSVVSEQIELVRQNEESGELEKTEKHNSDKGDFERVYAVISGDRRAMDIVNLELKNGSAGLAIDMRELEEAQDELKLQMSAHASTLDKLLTAVAIFGPDKSLKFFNPAYVSLWGLDAEWLRTGPKDGEILDRLRADRKLPEQADYKAWKKEILDTYTNLEPLEDEWHLPDNRALRVVAEQHPFGGVTYLYENLTERFALESNINELLSVQRETLNHSQEGVAFFGKGGRLELYNPAFAKLWQLDEDLLKETPHIDVVIKECRKLFDYEDAWDDLKANVTSIVEKRDVSHARITRPDGVVLDLSLVPLPDGATLLTYVDVSDSWRTEKALNEKNEALKTADELKTQFLNHMSYQLRTPLTNIIGFAETMDIGIAGDMSEKQSEYVKNILGSSQSLLGIINNILDMASIDAGNIELSIENTKISDLISQTVALVNDEIENKQIKFIKEIDSDLDVIQADPARLKQVVYNIVTNALSFSKTGGTVKLSAKRDGEDMLLSVSDNGRGMEAEDLQKIFGRFVSNSKGAQRRGTGLGLSLVKSFVELHGGHVEASSEKGKGTEVQCRIPINGVTQNPVSGDDANSEVVQKIVGN